jgi:hypothetical protein
VCASVVGAVLSGFAVLLLTGEYENEGRVVISVTRTHGLHAGDLFVIAGWALSLIALVVLTVRPGWRASR